ncbi:Maf family protein [Alteromonas confluentis]|uniref:7-methyl-GTP pyrophosphatase n=1 Tax=Alteromonas confluentis TaxID=1656094 RepID=A0A1E7ZGG8_9ALTE|nr:Maf family nucleotide pyrophosphatase [Alteromonas confluentis]OFC72615.1 septum formation protein Maf [Alteromonas confluentis]
MPSLTTKQYPKFILASSSKYRQAQFASLGISAEAIAPDIDEAAHDNELPQALAERLASAKAAKIAGQHADSIIIASDQVAVVCVHDKLHQLGKPGSFDKARQQLQMCSGRCVTFYSALTVHHAQTKKVITDTDVTQVWFRELSDAQINAYLHNEQPYDCAGSFKSEGKGVLLFERIDSRDPNALIGLPVMLLRDMLAEFNIDLLTLATSMSQ